MDPYISNFVIQGVDTYSLQEPEQVNAVLSINKHASTFNIVHNNIRSICHNIDAFNIFLDQIEIEFECIILTETWEILDTDIFNRPNYKLLYSYGSYNQNDGVVAFIKSGIYRSHEVIKLDNSSLLKVIVQLSSQTVTIYACYRSPATNTLAFLNALEVFLNEEKHKSDYKVWVGDLNIDIMNPSEETQNYLDILSGHGLVSVINNPTRLQINKQHSCLDHIFINARDFNYDTIIPLVVETDITDHCTVLAQIIVPTRGAELDRVKYYKKTNTKKLTRLIQSVNWEEVVSGTNLDTVTCEFVDIIKRSIRNSTEYVKINAKNRKRKPWVTNSIITEINIKNQLYNQLKHNPSNETLKYDYNCRKKSIAKMILQSKRDYYRRQIESSKDSRQLWKTVEEIAGRRQNERFEMNIKNNNGEVIADPKLVSECFNDFFVNVGRTISRQNRTPEADRSVYKNSCSIYLAPTDELEVKATIHQLKNKKSPGHDGITAENLKAISDHISYPLAEIINRLFEAGYFPEILKLSVVIPVYKQGNKCNLTNYRPISLITCISKVIEKLIQKRFSNFLEKHRVLSDRQYGFRTGKSTNDAICELVEKVYGALDDSTPSLAVFLDLAKAFDTVDHTILLNTLESVGIRGPPLKLIKTYLTGRKQVVKIGEYYSSWREVVRGVPQGTVLGPQLFLIYLNELYHIETCGDIISFADDTVIFYKDQNWYDLKKKVERDLITLKKWFNSRLLEINFDKTYYVPFKRYDDSLPDFNLHCEGGFSIPVARKMKYLGVIIDCHMRWDIHIDYIIRKLRYVMYKYKYISKYLEFPLRKVLYHSLVETHLTYGILSWGRAMAIHLYKLEIMQKRFLRILLQAHYRDSSSGLYADSGVMDVKQIFFSRICMMQYREQCLLRLPDHRYETRNKSKYILPQMKKTVGQHSCQYLMPKAFNSLPSSVREIATFNAFKKTLQRYILASPRDDVKRILYT